MHKSRPLQLVLTVWLMRLTGLVVIMSPLLKHTSESLMRRLPLGSLHLSSSLAIIAGLTLIYVADQLANRKQQALRLALALLTLVILAEILHYHNPLPAILAVSLAGILIANRQTFTVRSDSVSLQRGLYRAALVLGLAILYGVFGFLIIDGRAFGMEFDLATALGVTLRQFFALTNAVTPLTSLGRWFLDSLDLIGITAFVLALSALFRPIRFRFQSPAADRERAYSILAQTNGTTEDYFKIWPEDKHYFFSRDRQAFLAFGVARGVAMVLDGPSGKAASYVELLRDYEDFCEVNGWLPVILHAESKMETLLDDTWRRYSIGQEAVIDITRFTTETLRDKHWRYVTNRAKRDELTFELWQSPLDEIQLTRLAKVSRAWLAEDGRREYRFIMGYYDEQYLRNCNVGVLRRGKEVVAYANLVPSFDPDAISIDHMRSMKDISSVSMYYLLENLILVAHEAGQQAFNLGLAPLAESPGGPKGFSTNMLRGLKTLVKPVYSFDGVAQFKQKFRPDWEERYLFIRGRATDLPRVGLALYDLVNFSDQK